MTKTKTCEKLMCSYSFTERVVEFCRNPFDFVPIGEAQEYIANSKLSALNGLRKTNPYLINRNEEMSIESMLGKKHFVLYSGGKESLLTCKILDFFGVDYQKVAFRESVKNIQDRVFCDSDLVLGSEIIENFGNEEYGRHIPLIAYYIGMIAEYHPGAIIWVGAANVNEISRFMMGNADHSDHFFKMLNNEHGITVYSCVNCLSEFDIYRICKRHYNYDIKSSFDDNPEKEDRMRAFSLLDDAFDIIAKIPKAERNLMFDWEFINNSYIKLKEPTVFDFRSDVSLFLSSIDDLEK